MTENNVTSKYRLPETKELWPHLIPYWSLVILGWKTGDLSGFIEDIEQLSEDGWLLGIRWRLRVRWVPCTGKCTHYRYIAGSIPRIMDDAIVDGDSELDNCTLSEIVPSKISSVWIRPWRIVAMSIRPGVYHGELSGHASVTGHVQLQHTQCLGAASVSGFAVVRTSTAISGNAQASGRAKVMQ